MSSPFEAWTNMPTWLSNFVVVLSLWIERPSYHFKNFFCPSLPISLEKKIFFQGYYSISIWYWYCQLWKVRSCSIPCHWNSKVDCFILIFLNLSHNKTLKYWADYDIVSNSNSIFFSLDSCFFFFFRLKTW